MGAHFNKEINKRIALDGEISINHLLMREKGKKTG
jgi:hypothetical protein